MKKFTITVVLCLVQIFSFAQETKTFKKDNISFEYPKNWVVNNAPGLYVLVNEPPKKQLSVQTTFDIVLELGYDSLETYCKGYESEMGSHEYFKDFKVNKKEEIIFKEMKAIEYNCTATVSYLPIEWKSIIFMKDGKIYKLSTTSLIGQFLLNSKITDKIFDSFKIK